MIGSLRLQGSALLCFVLAEQVAAHTPPIKAIDGVRLVGAVEVQSAEDSYVTGKRLLAADDVVGALAAFQQTLTASPNSVDALNAIGVSYDQLGRTDLARSFYEAGLAIDPASPRLLNNLGYSLFLRGDLAAAIAPLRAAAASGDPEAAASARATLAMIVENIMPERSSAATVELAPSARVELTNDGEQRLVFGPVGREQLAATDDQATMATVAAAWTDRDDAALRDRVSGEERAEQLALAAADTGGVSEDATVPAPAPNPAPAPAAAGADRQLAALPPLAPSVAYRAKAPAGTATALVVGEIRADAALARRRAAYASKREVALTGHDPAQRIAAVFDSDDPELNAFAARMAATDTIASRPTLSRDEQISARFRT